MTRSVRPKPVVVVVVTGGDPVDPPLLGRIPPNALVVAADSGVEQAAALNMRVDVAVGDFDSVSPSALLRASIAGAKVERHPEAKDATDLELGLRTAQRLGAARVIVLGGHGGRVDHFLANALLIASPDFASMHVEAFFGAAHLTVIHDDATLSGEPGDLVSLLPVGGTATGVTTDGLLYPLTDEALAPGSTRGVSNEFAESTAAVAVRGGVLLAVQPGLPGTHVFARIATDTKSEE